MMHRCITSLPNQKIINWANSNWWIFIFFFDSKIVSPHFNRSTSMNDEFSQKYWEYFLPRVFTLCGSFNWYTSELFCFSTTNYKIYLTSSYFFITIIWLSTHLSYISCVKNITLPKISKAILIVEHKLLLCLSDLQFWNLRITCLNYRVFV